MTRPLLLLATLALVTLAPAAFGQAAVPERYGVDLPEIGWLKAQHPSTLAKLESGEALLAKSPSREDMERAAALFKEARTEVPESTLLARRHCQVATALGGRAEAIEACELALKNRVNSALALRAMAGAWMAGPEAPTPTELGRAIFHAERVKRLMQGEPWGHAAQCDIAAKLGDTDMLNRCVSDLQNIAPEHYETRRHAAILSSVRPGWKMLLGNLALAALVIGTALHALFVRRRGVASLTALAVFGAALGAAPPARAETPAAAEAPAAKGAAATAEGQAARAEPPRKAGSLSKHPLDDANPVASVPTPEERDKDPLEYGYFLMDLGDQAEAAIKREDHKTAAKLYHAMAKAVPDTAVGFRKACEQYELAKDLTTASEFCAAALTLEGVKLSDYLRYGAVVFAKPGAPTPADVGNLDKAVAKLKDSEETRAAGLEIQCTLGFRLSDQARLQECAPALAALAPDSPKSTFFDWALALKKKEFGAAERLLEKARAAEKGGAGLGKKQIALMEKATSEAMPIWRKGFRDWRVGASIALALFAGLAMLLSKRRATVQSEAAAQT